MVGDRVPPVVRVPPAVRVPSVVLARSTTPVPSTMRDLFRPRCVTCSVHDGCPVRVHSSARRDDRPSLPAFRTVTPPPSMTHRAAAPSTTHHPATHRATTHWPATHRTVAKRTRCHGGYCRQHGSTIPPHRGAKALENRCVRGVYRGRRIVRGSPCPMAGMSARSSFQWRFT